MPQSPFSRRAALRVCALGLASAIAGCGADTDGDATATTDQYDDPMVTGTGTRHTQTHPEGYSTTGEPATPVERTLAMGETATSRDGVAVNVAEPRVRKIIYTYDVGSSVHPYPAGSTDSQFLTVDVTSEGRDLSALDLAAVIEGQRSGGDPFRHDYDPGSSGTLSLRVPVVAADRGAVEWRPTDAERYRWTLPDDVVSAIGRSPAFTVTEWSVPDAIERGEPFTASLSVENAGDRDGRFLATVLRGGSSSVPFVGTFTISIAAGETATKDLSGDDVRTRDSSATAIFDWGLGERETTFDVTG